MENLAKTLSIHLVVEMEAFKEFTDKSFDYNIALDLDGTGEIKITPISANVSFIDAYLISEYSDLDIINDNSRTKAINLVANIELTDTLDDDYVVNISDVGEVVISPYAGFQGVPGSAKFVAVKEEKQSQLVIEEGAPEVSELQEKVEESDETDCEVIYSFDITEDLTEEEASSDSRVIIQAPDMQTAVKYAEQNARMNAKDNPDWADAEVISIKKVTPESEDND